MIINNLTGETFSSFDDMINGSIIDKPVFTENYLQKMFICGYLAGREAKEKDLINDIADGNMLKAFENAKKLLSND